MKLNRRKLRKLILQEMKRDFEGLDYYASGRNPDAMTKDGTPIYIKRTTSNSGEPFVAIEYKNDLYQINPADLQSVLSMIEVQGDEELERYPGPFHSPAGSGVRSFFGY